MRSGELQQIGAPDDVYQYPANVFVARFMGSPPMNALQAEWDAGALLDEKALRIPVAGWIADRLPGSEVRPRSGEVVYLSPSLSGVRIFAADTGQVCRALAPAPVAPHN